MPPAAERWREAPDQQRARRGIRTLTPFRAADFESAASASSAIRAGGGHGAQPQRSLAVVLLRPKRRVRWLVIVVLTLVLVREWSIRHHEAAIGVWPRADREPTA